MSKADSLVRAVLGPCRGSIRPLVYAIDRLIELSFAAGLPAEEIQVTKEVYPQVAKQLYKNVDQKILDRVTKRIERMANKCWDEGDRALLDQIIGKSLPHRPTPRELLIYFAAYAHYDMPYYKAIEDQLAALF